MEAKLLRKEPISYPNVIKTLSCIGNAPERSEVQNKVLTIVKKFKKLKEDKAQKLIKELKSLGLATLTEEHITEIVNILPEDLAELKYIFAGSKTTINPENFKKINEIILKYKK